MDILKEKLLSTEYFIDNNYLDKYIDLCNNGSKVKTTTYSELHHILQFSYFTLINNIANKADRNKLRKSSIKIGTPEYNNITKNNQVYLSYYSHCLAHYYLYQCTTGKLKQDNEIAFCKMTDRNLQLRNCSDSEIKNLLLELDNLRNDPKSLAYKNKCIDIAVENYYAKGGYKLVQSELLKLNINSTKGCIKARANKLNIRGARYIEGWTDDELLVIKEKYPVGGYTLCKQYLPKRSKFAIQARAKYLNILAPGASKANASWTADEDEIIKKYYSIGGTKLCKKYLINRSEKAIKHRANEKLKIFKNKG